MKKDFTDSLNPILLKELTQGVRTKSFSMIFLLTQLAMLFATLYLVANKDSGYNHQKETLLFWLAIAAPFILLLPAIALDSINSEIKIKTMEMLYLSRLSATRIVIGKYFSQIVQTLLLAVTILPYVIMRYFAGGINPGQEVLIFLLILTISCIVTALSVTASSFSVKYAKTQRLRVILMLFLCVFILWLSMAGIAVFMFQNFFGSFIGLIDLFMIIFMSPFVIYQILSLGISQVSPEAENNLPLKRLNGLFILVLYVIFRYFSDSFIVVLPVIFCFIISGIEGIFTKDIIHKSTYRPVFKRKSLALLYAPNVFGSTIWMNFCFLIILLTTALEIFAAETGSYHYALSLAPVLLSLLFYIVINFSKIVTMQPIISFIVAFFLPTGLFLSLLFHDSIIDFHDSYEIIAIPFVFYLNFFIPYGLAFFVARMLKQPLKLKYFLISFVTIIMLGTCSVIFKEMMNIRVRDSIFLFPMELFEGLFSYRQDRSIFNCSIVYIQALIVALPVYLTLKDSARFFSRKYKEYQPEKIKTSPIES